MFTTVIMCVLLVQINKQQRDAAKKRNEWDVVEWHQKQIDQLNRKGCLQDSPLKGP
jgi:hypothetical protein